VWRRTPTGQEVGVDLLLAGSDAFWYLADQLAAEYARRHDAGEPPEHLEWVRRLAEVAGWWCGRLEAEADHVAGFDSNAEPALSDSMPASAEFGTGIGGERRNGPCRRRRRPPR